ncbi:gamma carbonic anhydrase family protein [Gordonia liuliyuniae]|uniref:Gamma carbonic anhydrase family protein n=1 Tax=Gordonia liuliyuniae TaxID=2911517 RepID=A0ABS9IWJ5_9ACTN|nr:gamma carbonic anhydrase family protein [Gordonia liuliyuniae]MCF8589929.1 gamma carbonic anhydrase family protein [Gordonia liuliyuniae]
MTFYALGDSTPLVHPTAYVHPMAVVIGRVTIGAEASVWPGAVLRGDLGTIVIGEHTSIQDNTVLHTTQEWPTIIGDDCVVGHIVHLEGCTVGDRCLIGSGSVVLNRAQIGDDSVVGAQALVAEDTVAPPRTMLLGVPARPRGVVGDDHSAWIAYGVDEYRENASRFRADLRPCEPELLPEKSREPR